MTIPTAKDMADAVSSVFGKLHDNNIVTNHYDVIPPLVSALRGQGDIVNWGLRVEQEKPILFRETEDVDGKTIQPRLYASLKVNGDHEGFPFEAWNIALEVFYKEENPVPLMRWHFDLANNNQSGPHTHLQGGGHFRDHRPHDIPLKIPRWYAPAFDLILLAETIVANFYEDDWFDKIRDDRTWCSHVNKSQSLCFKPFIKQMTNCLAQSNVTLLKNVWVRT